ncbi:Noggin-2, partial [Stegodyphus mimosarum]
MTSVNFSMSFLPSRFRDLLWLHSHCPLLQKWKDLGPRFWPRWFLENSCAPRPTCSFPRGMVCKPHKSEDKVLLRWHCQNWDEKKNCEWLKVQYPLVTECRCGCQ